MQPGRYLIFIFLACLCACQKADHTRIRNFNKIVFLSNREASEGKFDIFMMNPDGSHPQNLTSDRQSVNILSQPLLSPDGKKILFISFSDKTRLDMLDITSRKSTTLMEIKYTGNIESSFSPTGDKIVCVLTDGRKNQIHVVRTDGSGEVTLSGSGGEDMDPVFSPDGSEIIFVSRQGGLYQLNSINVDGTEETEIYKQKEKLRFPDISENGKDISFIAYKNNICGIDLINRDGNKLHRLSENLILESQPKFTPDGEKIVFLSRQRGIKFSDICVIDSDGSQFKNLTAGLNNFNQMPCIIPSGKAIIFQSININDAEIYRVDIDGRNLVNLTKNPKLDQYPSL